MLPIIIWYQKNASNNYYLLAITYYEHLWMKKKCYSAVGH